MSKKYKIIILISFFIKASFIFGQSIQELNKIRSEYEKNEEKGYAKHKT